MASKTIVLGTLGDLVKKIIELELLERKPSRDTTIQMAAYYDILHKWPVESSGVVESLMQAFRVQAAKHKQIELDMDNAAGGMADNPGTDRWVMYASILVQITSRYINSKKTLRIILKQLNDQGQHVGLSPITFEEETVDEPSGNVST